MPSVDVIEAGPVKKGTMDLDDRFFGVAVKEVLIHEAVRVQLSNRRRGTASTRTRGEVRGGGKKPYRQKGTGNARAGSIRSPIWKGGGTIFGPRPRRYILGMTRKKARAALYSVLTSKVNDGALKVVEDLPVAEPKTRSLSGTVRALGLQGSVLILLDGPAEPLKRAAGNLPWATVQDLAEVNVLDILRHDHILTRRGDLERLQQSFRDRTDR